MKKQDVLDKLQGRTIHEYIKSIESHCNLVAMKVYFVSRSEETETHDEVCFIDQYGIDHYLDIVNAVELVLTGATLKNNEDVLLEFSTSEQMGAIQRIVDRCNIYLQKKVVGKHFTMSYTFGREKDKSFDVAGVNIDFSYTEGKVYLYDGREDGAALHAVDICPLVSFGKSRHAGVECTLTEKKEESEKPQSAEEGENHE